MDSSRFFSRHAHFFLKGAILSILLVLPLKVPVTKGETYANSIETVPGVASANADAKQILLVLEKKIGNQKVMKKAKDKLEALNGRRARLIANLCERVETSDGTAAADISLLLVSVLIILS